MFHLLSFRKDVHDHKCANSQCVIYKAFVYPFDWFKSYWLVQICNSAVSDYIYFLFFKVFCTYFVLTGKVLGNPKLPLAGYTALYIYILFICKTASTFPWCLWISHWLLSHCHEFDCSFMHLLCHHCKLNKSNYFV